MDWRLPILKIIHPINVTSFRYLICAIHRVKTNRGRNWERDKVSGFDRQVPRPATGGMCGELHRIKNVDFDEVT
jgi:hypothetical protein